MVPFVLSINSCRKNTGVIQSGCTARHFRHKADITPFFPSPCVAVSLHLTNLKYLMGYQTSKHSGRKRSVTLFIKTQQWNNYENKSSSVRQRDFKFTCVSRNNLINAVYQFCQFITPLSVDMAWVLIKLCVLVCVCVCSWMFVCVCVTCTDLCSWLWQGNRGLGVLLISRWPHHGCRAVSPTINLPAWSLQMAPDSPALSPVSPAPRLPPNKKLPHYSSLGSALFGRHVEEWSFTIILFMKPRQRRPGLHLIGVIKRSPPND